MDNVIEGRGGETCCLDRTDPALAYWIKKYLLLHGCNSFASMSTMTATASLRQAAESQDKIGWFEFLHGKALVEIGAIQRFHCAVLLCQMNGTNLMKHFVSHILHIIHSQWLYQNFTLHKNARGHLLMKERQNVLMKLKSHWTLTQPTSPQKENFSWKWTSMGSTVHPLKNNLTGWWR
mmetsp:Transcript_28742/g.61286  ORF Transcript_28742/g.61286 Transcript_28742/m.61286 type:complete len:178 (-) Transcript_28742:502-1035(-)